jgi:ribosomal-protein-alanine N-acetyltransferase
MRIELPECVVRPWKKTDLESLVRYANNRNVWRNLRDRFPHPYTRQDGRWWLDHAAVSDAQTNFAIEVEGEAAGGIGFVIGEDVHRRTAEIGYWLGEQFWGRGIASAALIAMSDYAFKTHDLVRIYAGVFSWNPASMRVLEKAGYIQEAVLRSSVLKDGEILDQHLYANVRNP